MLDIKAIRDQAAVSDRYERQLERLRAEGKSTDCVEMAVNGAVDNITRGDEKSFVIYGEPQSGKTEMMIALTARLLDVGQPVIVHLLTDNVQLLDQNLDRFKRSGLAPTPRGHKEVLDDNVDIGLGQWVIFCKKNSQNLKELNDKLSATKSIIVIDDEADFATPNAKVNKGEQTKINELVGELISKGGSYVGVTATPARLDLNNTFMNDTEEWIEFPSHSHYTGQNTFFPVDKKPQYRLTLIPDTGDPELQLKNAVRRFLVNVAFLNLAPGVLEDNYSMLIHTSGKKDDHDVDRQHVEDLIKELSDTKAPEFPKRANELGTIANELYPGQEQKIVGYIVQQISSSSIVVMNSNRDKNLNMKSATSPVARFTFAIGGNIVSRGVTFENLLSMYFTRNVKSRLQQDTYIQRARMFGTRGPVLDKFELTIPKNLYRDWYKCFVFHRLALRAVKRKRPVWLEDSRVSAVASSSVDLSTVSMDRAEMSFEMFRYSDAIDAIVDSVEPMDKKLGDLQTLLGEDCLPTYLFDFIEEFGSVVGRATLLHPTTLVTQYDENTRATLRRGRGFLGGAIYRQPGVDHHFKIFRNEEGNARLFYRYVGDIRFLESE